MAGASGYAYKEWQGSFYPEKIKPEEMLAWYAQRLPTVEINNTFYQMPKTAVLENWSKSTPATFRFSIKASRRITHLSRLKADTAADSVAGNTFTGIVTRLTRRYPFQVGLGAIGALWAEGRSGR